MRDLIAGILIGLAWLGLVAALEPILLTLPRQHPAEASGDWEDWRFQSERRVWSWER